MAFFFGKLWIVKHKIKRPNPPFLWIPFPWHAGCVVTNEEIATHKNDREEAEHSENPTILSG